MKKILITLMCCLIVPAIASAQKAKDILENAEKLKDGTVIFLRYENGELKYSNTKEPTSFISLPDSLYFVTNKTAVNVFIGTLNPLTNTITQEISFSADLIDKAEDEALGAIVSLLNNLKVVQSEKITQLNSEDDNLLKLKKGFGNNQADSLIDINFNNTKQERNKLAEELKRFNDIKKNLEKLIAKLEDSKKKRIKKVFTSLKELQYVYMPDNRETSANDILKASNTEIEAINKEFDNYDDTVKAIATKIEKYPVEEPNSYVEKFVFSEILSKQVQVIKLQKQRLTNLEKAYKLVKDAQKVSAATVGYTNIGTIKIAQGKIAHMAIYVNEEGMKLDKDDEMVSIDKKVLLSKIINVRKHQLFVPEVVAGIAYTFLSFPKYAAETDATGNTVVTNAGDENFKKLNITAMINYNLFLPGANVHPFIQIGVGAKSDYPTLLTGLGLRFNGVLGRRLALSGGFASTWIKTLNKLNVGDKVSGTAELEADISHEFKFPLKPYVGVQISF